MSTDVKLVDQWKQLYFDFKSARNLVFAQYPLQRDEKHTQWMLRLAAEAHKSKNELFQNVREAGNRALTFVFTDLEGFKQKTGKYMHEAGYSEVTNVFQVVAGLEAVNCPYEFFSKLNVVFEVESLDWLQILAINFSSDYLPSVRFLREYLRVQQNKSEWLVSEIRGTKTDPFPEWFMAELVENILKSKWIANVDDVANSANLVRNLAFDVSILRL